MAKKDKEKKSGGGFANMFKKQPVDESSGSSEAAGKTAAAANNRKSSPILHETVFETVAGICRKNKLFVVRRDDEDVYVGIYLSLDDIGGLSAKTKDESKGSMVSQINSGHISVMFNSELDAQNGLIFIPTEDTISHMMEYALLREDRNYALVLIDAHGEGDFEKTDVLVNLEFLEKCHNKKIHIKTKLGKYLEDVQVEGQVDLSTYGNSNNGSSSDSAGSQEDYEPPEQTFEEPGGSDALDEHDVNNWQPNPSLTVSDDDEDFSGADMGSGDEYGGDGYGDEYGGSDDSGYGDEYGGSDDGSDDSGEPEEEQEIDYSMSRQAVSRRFFNDDLAVELDTAGLDTALSGYAEFRPLQMRPDGSWLSDIINPLIVAANQELFDLHRRHLGEVQISYLNRLEAAYLEQMSQLSSPEIKDYLDKIQAEYEKNKKETLPALLAEKQAAAKADWDKRIKEYGEAARVAAEQSYKNKYQTQFDEAYAQLEIDLQHTLDTEFASERGNYLTSKKGVLLQALDLENKKLIEQSIAEYRDLLPEEEELFKHHQSVIKDAIDRHREEEMARIRVLDDELKRDTSVARVMSECDEKVNVLTSEFESRIAALQSDMNQMSARHQSELEAKNQAMTELRSQYTHDRDDWTSRTNELLAQIRQSDEVRERDIKIRTDEMRAERDSYSEKYDQLQKTQKHGYTLMIVITIAAAIAALFIGMLVGSQFLGGKSDKPDAPDVTPPGYTDVQNPGGGDVQPGVPENPGGDVQTPVVPDDVPDGSTQAPVDDQTQAPAQDPGGSDISDDQWAGMQDPEI